jgi:DNA-binding response OmpR family regulator
MPIRAVEEINPNLIVIDYLLGNGFGDELCLEIKSNSSTQQIPVILFSASHNLAQIAHDSCADAYINKPFDLIDFVELVGDLAL